MIALLGLMVLIKVTNAVSKDLTKGAHRGPSACTCLRSSRAGGVGVSVRGGRLRVGAIPHLFSMSFTSSLFRIIRLVRSPAYPELAFSPYLCLSFLSARTASPHKHSSHPPLFFSGLLRLVRSPTYPEFFFSLFLLILTIIPELTLEGGLAGATRITFISFEGGQSRLQHSGAVPSSSKTKSRFAQSTPWRPPLLRRVEGGTGLRVGAVY
jgi:hypothetical protein